jgi:hypothetical protein
MSAVAPTCGIEAQQQASAKVSPATSLAGIAPEPPTPEDLQSSQAMSFHKRTALSSRGLLRTILSPRGWLRPSGEQPSYGPSVLLAAMCRQPMGTRHPATFPALPCLQVLRKEISNNTVSEKINQEKKRNQYTIMRSLTRLYPSESPPTLASEQRNARATPPPAALPALALALALALAPWSPHTSSSRRVTSHIQESGHTQTSNSRSTSGRKYRKQSEAPVRPPRGL